MKKNNGFTLIELLAVILILGIIALIAIPMVNNIVIQSKKSSFETTANNVVSAIESACEIQNLKGETLTTTYTFTAGVATPAFNIKGNLPTNGTAIVNSSCEVDLNVTNGTFIATKNITEDSVTIEVGEEPALYTVYANGTEFYFNPVTGLKCDLAAYTANTGASNNGMKTGCMKWYTFNDNGNTASISMILDHNTTARAMWNSGGSNAAGMNEAATTLALDTSTWKTGLDQRLITANEVALITANTGWTINSLGYYLASNTATQLATCTNPVFTGCTYKWLYDRTSTNSATANGSLYNASTETYGYWTSSIYSGGSTSAWRVDCIGRMSNMVVANTSNGIRPVITILKSIIS